MVDFVFGLMFSCICYIVHAHYWIVLCELMEDCEWWCVFKDVIWCLSDFGVLFFYLFYKGFEFLWLMFGLFGFGVVGCWVVVNATVLHVRVFVYDLFVFDE